MNEDEYRVCLMARTGSRILRVRRRGTLAACMSLLEHSSPYMRSRLRLQQLYRLGPREEWRDVEVIAER